MKSTLRIGVAALFVAGPGGAAFAADAGVPPIVEQQEFEPIPAPLACCTGPAWYIRGDIGYGFPVDPDVSQGGALSTNEAWDETVSLGGGIGYRFGDLFRVDLTGEYRFPSQITDTDASGARGTVDITSTVLLANVYVDLVRWGGLTPYIGAGIGAAYNELDTIAKTGGAVTQVSGDGSWSLAAAAMAGVGLELTEGMLIDANYRFLYLSDVESGVQTNLGTAANPIAYDDLMAHEIRVGFRYEFY
jgi:opacity protein-like surface antigen